MLPDCTKGRYTRPGARRWHRVCPSHGGSQTNGPSRSWSSRARSGHPRRVAQAFADTIRKPQTDDGPHASSEYIKGSRENRERVAYDGEYLALLYPVGPAAGIEFYEIGRGLRNAFHEAQRFCTGFQYRYKERRKCRCNHLRGEIVEEAGQPQEENIAR